MIELEDVKKNYMLAGQEVPVLKGISAFIAQGEFVSIMGPSGSGKSTLSAILGCLSTPSSGRYRLAGYDVSQLTQNQLARIRNSTIGFIFQDFNLLSGLTAVENVELPLIYGGIGARERRQRAMECLQSVGLENKAGNRPYQLSGGQKQRVAIARALVNHPKFLFADEPTGALDKKTGQEILGILQRLNMSGHTIIQVTHSPADALYSKRILHIVDGHIVREEAVEKPTIGPMQSTAQISIREETVAKLWRVAELAPVTGQEDFPAIQKLIELSEARASHVAAVGALIKWSDFAVHETIEKLFTSADWVVRAEVIRCMAARPKAEAITFYMRALGDSNAWVRHKAMTEIKKLSQEEFSAEQWSKITAAVYDPDERVRASAIYCVGKTNTPDKKNLIEKCLSDPDNRVRANAIECIHGKELKDYFRARLCEIAATDKNNRARANAAWIVSKVDPEFGMKIAMQMTESENILLRSSGAWLLGKLASDRCHQLLIQLLQREKEEVVLGQVIKSLAQLTQTGFKLSAQVDCVVPSQGEGRAAA